MQQLKKLYDKHIEGIEKLYDELKKNNLFYSCSYPLLLSTWEEDSIPNVMFIGQETNGWDWPETPECPDNEGSVDYLMALYKWFNLGKGSRPNNTLIWQYFRQLAQKLGQNSEHAFIWNNINKIGKDSGTGRPNAKVTSLENQYFNILADELEVFKPKVCVFFTGPNYDRDIRAKLPDVEFLPIQGYGYREFVRIKSAHLPENSFRTYHPGYGNRYYDWYQGVMDKIAEMTK